MESRNKKIALLAASILLEYPDAHWYESLEELQEEVESLRNEACFEALMNFIEFSKSRGQLNMAELYIDSFEFTKETTLYMTYYTFKEKRERGTALLNLKNRYSDRGLNLAENELPDFLPVILEYTAATGEEDILKAYLPELKNIYNCLLKGNNPYAKVLQALLIALASENSMMSANCITTGGVNL